VSEILWTPHYFVPPSFAILRSYTKGVAIGWIPGATLVASGNPWILQEHTYGGYKKYLKFRELWWNWNSHVFRLDNVIEDYYAIHPVTGAHVSNGGVNIGYNAGDALGGLYNVYADVIGGTYYFLEYPPAPSDWWFGNPP
jgi:hypothetical protein